LIGVLAFQSAKLSWQLLAPVQVTSAQADLPAPLVVDVSDRVQLSTLQQASLLGAIAVQTAQPVVKLETVKAVRSRQNIKLLGVVVGSGDQVSVAIMRVDNHQRVFSPGDYLINGGGPQLLQVLADRVVILANGRQEYIELEKAADPTPGVSRNAAVEQPLPSEINLNQPRFTNLVKDYRTKLVSDPLSFGQYVQLRPQIENGRISGYRLQPGRDKRLFSALGLQSGDVVTHVNQLDLSSPESLNKLMALVTQGGRIQVGIRRGEQSVDVDVDL
jgi:general secretion pathway protein C